MKEAIGTSLLVITSNSRAGLLGHLHYGGFNILLAPLVTGLAVAGTLIGVALAQRASRSVCAAGLPYSSWLLPSFWWRKTMLPCYR